MPGLLSDFGSMAWAMDVYSSELSSVLHFIIYTTHWLASAMFGWFGVWLSMCLLLLDHCKSTPF